MPTADWLNHEPASDWLTRRRDVTSLQFAGALLIVASIVVAKLGDLLSSEAGNVIPLMAIVYAVVSSLNSVGVSVYQEQLFKVG